MRVLARDCSTRGGPPKLWWQSVARLQARAGHIDDAAATLRAALAHQSKGEREQQMLRNSLAQIYADGMRYSEAIAVYEEQLKTLGIDKAQVATDEEKLFGARVLQ